MGLNTYCVLHFISLGLWTVKPQQFCYKEQWRRYHKNNLWSVNKAAESCSYHPYFWVSWGYHQVCDPSAYQRVSETKGRFHNGFLNGIFKCGFLLPHPIVVLTLLFGRLITLWRLRWSLIKIKTTLKIQLWVSFSSVSCVLYLPYNTLCLPTSRNCNNLSWVSIIQCLAN